MALLSSSSKLFFKRNASTILTCVGAVGVVATSIVTAKATTKANAIIQEAREEKGEELTKLEKIKVAGPVYISPILLGTSTIACILGANILNKRAQASMVSAYGLLDQSYKRYKNKVIETYGEEAHEEIINAIRIETAEDVYAHAENLCTSCDLAVEEHSSEPKLFYDEYANRFFETTIEQVITAEYHFNRNYTLRGYAVLNELYDFLGLEPTDEGSELGWVICDDGTYWVDFNHRKAELKDGTEFYILETPFGPSMEWKEYYY